MERVRLRMPIYVIDCELKIVVDEVMTPTDKAWVGEGKAREKADEYAKKTGHSVCVVRPTSWH